MNCKEFWILYFKCWMNPNSPKDCLHHSSRVQWHLCRKQSRIKNQQEDSSSGGKPHLSIKITEMLVSDDLLLLFLTTFKSNIAYICLFIVFLISDVTVKLCDPVCLSRIADVLWFAFHFPSACLAFSAAPVQASRLLVDYHVKKHAVLCHI